MFKQFFDNTEKFISENKEKKIEIVLVIQRKSRGENVWNKDESKTEWKVNSYHNCTLNWGWMKKVESDSTSYPCDLTKEEEWSLKSQRVFTGQQCAWMTRE